MEGMKIAVETVWFMIPSVYQEDLSCILFKYKPFGIHWNCNTLYSGKPVKKAENHRIV
jgi:hypothetical protein